VGDQGRLQRHYRPALLQPGPHFRMNIELHYGCPLLFGG
jgi:hypothetical protein